MDLLPHHTRDFRSNAYWDRFFKTRGLKPFEWYGEFTDLCSVLCKYVKTTDKVLMVGCGNSQLSADMFDAGFKRIINIDTSSVVIKQMLDKNQTHRPEMKFLKMDVTEMDFTDGEFSVVIDKGTLDALLVNESEEVIENVDKALSQISRTMRLGARYLIITLLQEHILRKLLKFSSEMEFPIRFHRIEIEEQPLHKNTFCMPVFAVVITKFKKIPGMKQIFEIVRQVDSVQRVDTAGEVIAVINEMQKFAMMKQHLNKYTLADEQVVLELYSENIESSRYILYVLDSLKSYQTKYAVFIVPLKRETEWLFATNAGRRQLQKDANVQRLIIVTLQREHEYGDIEAIQEELSPYMLQLTPPKFVFGTKIPYLSVDDSISKDVEVVDKGRSEWNGTFRIENFLAEDEKYYRRLFFLGKQNLIQSECRLIQSDTKKKKVKKGKYHFVIDKDYLASKHHISTVAGVVLLPDFNELIYSGFRVLMIGLGGGVLASYIHHVFEKATIDVVEIDPEMVKVATKWFDFKEDSRMKAYVADGLDFMKQKAEQDEIIPYNMIVLDVNPNEDSPTQMCPPRPFLESDNLKHMKQLLSPKGVLVINTLLFNELIRKEALNQIKTEFQSIYQTNIEVEVNVILYVFPETTNIQTTDSRIPAELVKRLRLVDKCTSLNSTDLTESLKHLSIS
ncbi:eEF1A lysine and N-terminal methyltransferase [Octopus bimaculoides]|uniref:Methyltransferase domain-containing protein n=1 Tax=Octopus bimaculoides TaxID=37653 RepID=A0A0L8HZV8_OCTBM|nr:eEF1A lysine and N-terminal methyltransferase [Octopus bimaculoides]XP_014767917.1 eEF1A lysine and N-terminal methyltransferase [Octopus bimaculoides]|eukprot:XP_014767916.1 PREDICTED: methyltransferase-like protein 13 [Octopus bimaculoides]